MTFGEPEDPHHRPRSLIDSPRSHLHVLSAQLLLLKSTLSPFQHLLQAIRMQDDAKAAAAVKMTSDLVGKRLGFVSHEAKVYLGDVMDHTASVLDSLDLFSSLCVLLSRVVWVGR